MTTSTEALKHERCLVLLPNDITLRLSVHELLSPEFANQVQRALALGLEPTNQDISHQIKKAPKWEPQAGTETMHTKTGVNE